MTFRPTHRLTIRRPAERVDVIVVDGHVYTEEQWAARSPGWTTDGAEVLPTGWVQEGERYELAPIRATRTRLPGR